MGRLPTIPCGFAGWTTVLLLAAMPAAGQEFSQAERLFALHVKPLLAEKCFSCHGNDPQKIKGNLDLLTRESMLRGGEFSTKVLVPGDAMASDLYVAVTWKNPDLEMPPKENDRLTEQQTWFIRDWIDGGAPWPDETQIALIRSLHGEGVSVSTRGGLSEEWSRRRYQRENLWAYQPLPGFEARTASNRDAGGQSSSFIDDLILERMESLDVEPAPPSDRHALIRRATFDLTGLPPRPEEMEAFVNDPSDDDAAFAKVVDRLLASPHYGEHWGRHWLDVARYADSSGFANDYERGNAWRYRDYVVRAFNEDKPYDQFVREQVAGDELYAAAPAEERNAEWLIAAGFLRMGPWELTGMEVAKVARQRFLDDATDTVGQVFLAHPLQCARCHDHKFDPIPTRDYYSLQAVFATTQVAERHASFLPEENTDGFEEKNYLEARRQQFQETLRELDAKEEAAARAWAEERGLEYIPRNRGLKEGVPEEKLPPKNVGFSVEDYGRERMARKGLERLRWEMDRYEPVAFSVYSGATPRRTAVYAPVRVPDDPAQGDVEETAILAGGDPFSPAGKVRPDTLSAPAAFNPALGEVEIPETVSGRRTAFAHWLTHPGNPLVARVMVNRIWQWHFGRGLAGNPNNFGATGKKPTHPELLDALAAAFREHGWSVKHMHRLIMMSRAYRRSASHPDPASLRQIDPDGTSYAVFLPRRLTAEELRDAMLAVSGELNRTVGGIPNRPEIHLEAALQPRMVMGTFAPAWQPNPRPEQRHRRSLYALKIRGLRDPFMEVFNEPSPDLSCEGRDAGTATPQVFSLFNGRRTHDRAVAFARRLQGEVKAETHDRSAAVVDRAFQLVYGRHPAEEERRACLDHWRAMTRRHEGLELPRRNVPREVAREAVEENTGEKFSFVEKLEFYEDFVPDRAMADVEPETRGLAELCLVLFNANEFIYVY